MSLGLGGAQEAYLLHPLAVKVHTLRRPACAPSPPPPPVRGTASAIDAASRARPGLARTQIPTAASAMSAGTESRREQHKARPLRLGLGGLDQRLVAPAHVNTIIYPPSSRPKHSRKASVATSPAEIPGSRAARARSGVTRTASRR